MITGWFAPNNYEFVIVEMGGGIIAIFSFINFRKRSQLYTTTLFVMFTFSILYTALHLMREGTLLNIHYNTYLWFFISCMGTLFSLPLIYIFEKVFGLFSELTLIELTDTNSEALRELAIKAPGTFHHSIQVANLAEAAIDEIGGNTLLVRAGALHHDIGKTIEPQYFIENQVSGINPHDGLSFEESAEKIISHVKYGVELAEKYKLPSVIVDFIRTHHGTQTVQYFYKNYIKTYPDTEVDIKKFSYPGPLPFSKEMAVLMMADSVEAASRSIHEPNEEKITQLVNRIIDYQLQEKQYIHSDITLKDIDRIKKVLIRMLLNMYHVRIEYPQ
jgi:putative nucleotidyltransferase with HDIG domain